MTALLAKAAAMALVQHPVVNASCKDGKSFTYNSSINIAVAVAINGGLITPVLQDADKVHLLYVEIIFYSSCNFWYQKCFEVLDDRGLFGVDYSWIYTCCLKNGRS